MTSLQNIYVSCSIPDLHVNVSNWVTSIGGEDKLRLFNAGQPCGANGIPCGSLDLCPATPGVVGTVLSANAGQQCNTGGNKNPDSIVFTITYDQVTIQMNGDFEDFTNSATEVNNFSFVWVSPRKVKAFLNHKLCVLKLNRSEAS